MIPKKILVFGGPGSGKTTLAASLAKNLGYKHFDSDDYYWEITDPPYTSKIPFELRTYNLKADFEGCNQAVVSGSLRSWGEYWNTAFQYAIFLWVPHDVRMSRLEVREKLRYGQKLNLPEVRQNSREFLDWATSYDDLSNPKGIELHKQWINELHCPVKQICGELSLEETLTNVYDSFGIC